MELNNSELSSVLKTEPFNSFDDQDYEAVFHSSMGTNFSSINKFKTKDMDEIHRL